MQTQQHSLNMWDYLKLPKLKTKLQLVSPLAAGPRAPVREDGDYPKPRSLPMIVLLATELPNQLRADQG